MNLARLLVELRDLANAPSPDLARIARLMQQHQGMAESEVARFYLSRTLGPRVREMVASPDPRLRSAALQVTRYALPPGEGSAAVRRLVNDPATGPRSAARAQYIRERVRVLGVPDSRTPAWQAMDWEQRGIFRAIGNSYWRFGLDPSFLRSPFGTNTSLAAPPPGVSPALPGDVERLLTNERALCKLLGIDSIDALGRYQTAGAQGGGGYVCFEVPKAKGGTRTITAPRPALRKIQRALLDAVLSKVPAHPAAHGFVRGRSTVTNARPHQGSAVVVKMDLADFFPTVDFLRVEGLLVRLGATRPIAQRLAGVCTWKRTLPDGYVVWPGVLPQGAPTSPALANLVCRRMDSRLSSLASRFGATYTRYADDMTFSFKEHPAKLGRFLWWVDAVCQSEGFSVNAGKTAVMRRSGRMSVTGMVVNDGVKVPRDDRRRFRAELHRAKRDGVSAGQRARMQGFAAYVRMTDEALGDRWLKEVAALPAKADEGGGADGGGVP